MRTFPRSVPTAGPLMGLQLCTHTLCCSTVPGWPGTGFCSALETQRFGSAIPIQCCPGTALRSPLQKGTAGES